MTCCGRHTVVDSSVFVPDYHGKPLTEKFYARHEALNFNESASSQKRTSPNVEKYKEEIWKRLKYDPREHSLVPVTENQVYGWMEKLGNRFEDENDRDIMFYPKKCDEIMQILQKISYDMKRDRHFNALIRKS